MLCMGMDLSWVGSALVTVEVDDDGRAELAREPVLLNAGSKAKFKSRAIVGIENLAYVVAGIEEELDAVQPDLVALEDYSGGHGANPFVLAQIGEVSGAVRLSMYYREIPWVEIAAATLKKFVTGKGGGGKGPILKAFAERWGIDPEEFGKEDNVLDAYCLSRFAAALSLHRRGLYSPTYFERETFMACRIGGSDRLTKKQRQAQRTLGL